MPRFPFIHGEEKFHGFFENSAHNMVRAAVKLRGLLDECQDAVKIVADITELEHQGDAITHDIIAQLHRTFITPFDREDIALLAQRLDDVTDLIHSAADAILIYEITLPTLRAKELADTIVEAATEVENAMPVLRRRRELKNVLQPCVEINRLENVADKIYRAALSELFRGSMEIADIIKWREIYEYMESATDRCEDVANVLEGVALKHG